MKKLAIVVSLFITVLGVHAQAVNNGGTTATPAPDVLLIKDNSHNFGKIPQGRPAVYTFEIVNTGTEALKLDNVQASCGCTTPVKPEGAIQKGKDDVIKTGFNAAAAGPFNKSITIKVAGIQMPLQLHITGEVLTPDAYAKYEASKSTKGSR